MRARATRLLLTLVLVSGCAGQETLWVGDPPLQRSGPGQPLQITVAVRGSSFESPLLGQMGVTHRFARELSRSGLVRGVRYAPEDDRGARWELELRARDATSEDPANGRRAAWARYFPPAAPFLWLERSWSLELEAELREAGQVRASYAAQGEVQARYQSRADLQRVQLNGTELLMRNTIELLLAELARELPAITAPPP